MLVTFRDHGVNQKSINVNFKMKDALKCQLDVVVLYDNFDSCSLFLALYN